MLFAFAHRGADAVGRPLNFMPKGRLRHNFWPQVQDQEQLHARTVGEPFGLPMRYLFQLDVL